MPFSSMGAIIEKFVGQPYDLNSVLTPDQVWAKLDEPPEQVRVFVNSLITALNSAVSGSSGASNVGMTIIPAIDASANTTESIIVALTARLQAVTVGVSGAKFIASEGVTGLAGNDVQTLLTALKTLADLYNTNQTNALNTHKTSADHDSRYYTINEIDGFTVKLTGDQTVTGVKTFSSSPIVPTPTTPTQVANKSYVDSQSPLTIGNGSITDLKLSDATGDIKDRFTALQADVATQLVLKVDKITGKNLSTNDYDNTEKAEVAKIALKANTADVNTQIASVASGSPKASYATLALLQVAFPTGNSNIYLVTADGNWYYWNGSAWTAGGIYQSTGIATGSIGTQQLANGAVDEFKLKGSVRGKNLFNKDTVTIGYYVNYTTGVIMANASYDVSDFIPIQPSTNYYYNFTGQIAFYDVNKVYISGLNAINAMTSPSNAAYIRVTVSAAALLIAQLELGTVGTPYVPYSYSIPLLKVLNSNLDPVLKASLAFNSAEIVTGKNKFNVATITAGYYVNYANGTLGVNALLYASDFIPIKPNTVYTKTNDSTQLAFYDINKIYISGLVSPVTFTTPPNAVYLRMSTRSIVGIQLEEGSTATSYEPYLMVLASDVYLYASQIVGSIPRVTDIILPRKTYALLGDTVTIEQLNLYFANFIQGDPDKFFVDVVSNYGRQYKDFYRLEAGNTSVAQYNISSGNFDVTVNVNDSECNLIKSAKTNIEIVPKTSTTAVRHLGIGDSIMYNGGFVKQVKDKLPNVILQGSRECSTVGAIGEGRGGWTLSEYMTQIGHPSYGDSPFVFPATIAGDKYKGNTSFWKSVVTGLSTDYNFGGFQRIAKGWSGSSFLYDTNGYLITPNTGDTMVDPTKVVGSQWVQWDGSAWTIMATQPTTFEFNFAKYMLRFASAFVDGSPTNISILLGANDFQSTAGVTGIDAFIANLNTVIASIHSFDANIKVIICLPVPGVGQDGWGINVGCGGTSKNYIRNMQLESRRLLTEFDTDTALANKVYTCPMLCVLDTVNGPDTLTENANVYSTTQITRYSNWVHPSNSVGHMQMGDILAGTIQKFR